MKVTNSIYVHLAWPMEYPYSPRTWSLEEWDIWLSLIKNNGVDRVVFWPLFEAISTRFDSNDIDWLTKVKKIVSISKKKGLEIFLGGSVNTCISEDEYSKPFVLRNSAKEFSWRVGSAEYEIKCKEKYLKCIEFIGDIDGWWYLDRDPGNAFDTAPKEWMNDYLDFAKRANVNKYCLWMWGGWTTELGAFEGWRSKQQQYWIEESKYFEELLSDYERETWVCWPGHILSCSAHNKSIQYFPYNVTEPEPSIPYPERKNELDYHMAVDTGGDLPIIYNLQTPCLRTSSLLRMIKTNSFKKMNTSIEEIENCWCWNRESFESLKENLTVLENKLSVQQVDLAVEIKKWQEHIGFKNTIKRGYLFELLNKGK